MNKMQMMAIGALLAAGTALGGVRTNDYAWVRGTHYGPGGDPEQLVRELGYGRRVGLNATRFWLVRGAWNKDPKGYVERVRTFVRIAWEIGYYSMPILFNGNMINPKMLDDGEWANCAAYAKDIVLALKDEPGLLMWDVMNEPTCNSWVNAQKDKTEKERRRQKTWAFLRRACALVRELDSGSPITVGYTTAYEAEPTVSPRDSNSRTDERNASPTTRKSSDYIRVVHKRLQNVKLSVLERRAQTPRYREEIKRASPAKLNRLHSKRTKRRRQRIRYVARANAQRKDRRRKSRAIESRR